MSYPAVNVFTRNLDFAAPVYVGTQTVFLVLLMLLGFETAAIGWTVMAGALLPVVMRRAHKLDLKGMER